jgi:fibronectin type 3 domain-containing protein
MLRVYLLFIIGLSLICTGAVFTQDVITFDYESLVHANGSTADTPVGYAFDNFGPYTAFERMWVFYSNGENAVWRSKRIEENTEWSSANIIFSVTDSPQYNVAFDGRYFHIIRSVAGDLVYRRGEARPDGSIQFSNEVVAYTDPVWKLRTTNGAVPRHFSILVDSEKKVWVTIKVGDGDQTTSNFKPRALASVATDGTWEDREGFPVDLAPAFNIRGNGRASNIMELAPGKILFTWSNDRGSPGSDHGLRARVWEDGSLGPIEITGLSTSAATTSLVVPEEGIALLNRNAEVARRNANGTWEQVDPTGMVTSNWNVLTNVGNAVRIWDFSGSNIRYKETVNNGTTWGDLTTKWSATENVYQINGTHARGSQGSHHSLLWAAGSSPYDIYIGIEGSLPLPGAPALVSPANGETDLPEDITFSWNPVALGHTYDVQVAVFSDFSATVVSESGVTDTSLDVTGLDLNVAHYWRVRAVSEGNTPSEWSDVWQFGTVGIPPAPVLVSPADGTGNHSTSLNFSWEAAPGAERYQLQIATVENFSATFLDNDNITSTSHTVNGLDNDRTYYWRVRAINEFGEGDWSAVWSFTTQVGVPSIPVLVSPENEAIDQPVALTFDWEEADLAETYRLQVSTVSNFSSTVVNVGNLTSTSYEFGNLQNSQTYYWRVNATNATGTGGWSQVWSFTTIIAIPDAPVLVSPAHMAEGVSTKPLLEWNQASRAETYSVQVASDSAFTDIVREAAEVDATSYQVMDELNPFTVYYWRVNATNIGGTSEWSDTLTFTTGQAFPLAPTLVSPSDGGTDVVNALLLWNSVATATHYHLQISKSDDFATTVVNNASIANTFYEATNLEKFTKYYWRVRATSPVGSGDWSAVWNFTTGDIVSVERLDSGIPTEYAMGQNYPNPFNPTTSIRFALPAESTVRLEVYNMLGQRVATLIADQYFSAGIFETVWNARDDAGHEVSSGIYIYRISAGDFTDLKRMILMK